MYNNDDGVNETPSWLTDDPPAASPAPAPAAPVPAPAAAPVNNSSSTPAVATNTSSTNAQPVANAPADDPEALTAEEQSKLQGIILFTRLVNIGLSIACMTHSILMFIALPTFPKIWILSIYSFCGSCLICCLETQLKFVRTGIAVNFGFLFDPTLKFMFYLLMASVNMSFLTLFPQIIAGTFVFIAFYNTYVLCRYPAYRRLREKLAKEEDERIQKKLRKQMAKEASRQMFSQN